MLIYDGPFFEIWSQAEKFNSFKRTKIKISLSSNKAIVKYIYKWEITVFSDKYWKCKQIEYAILM